MHLVIRDSAFPIVLVEKNDGSPHLCVDYCQLNNKTGKNPFPIEKSLEALSEACCFSTIDLARGYDQAPVAEFNKAAICTPFQLWIE